MGKGEKAKEVIHEAHKVGAIFTNFDKQKVELILK